jgi:hypothetical protein
VSIEADPIILKKIFDMLTILLVFLITFHFFFLVLLDFANFSADLTMPSSGAVILVVYYLINSFIIISFCDRTSIVFFLKQVSLSGCYLTGLLTRYGLKT